MRKKILKFLSLCLLLSIVSVSATELPSQAIVCVIDNSRSMHTIDDTGNVDRDNSSDEFNLRGVACNLILDAAELYSNVEAGLIFFDDKVFYNSPLVIDGNKKFKLTKTDSIRKSLKPNVLLIPDGCTNTAAGIETAVELLKTSNAQWKKIILITDGNPSVKSLSVNSLICQDDQNQIQSILALSSQLEQFGIKLFSIGLGNNVNQVFLNKISSKTVIVQKASFLSKKEKELFIHEAELEGGVIELRDPDLPGDKVKYSFEIPPGIERARITFMLNKPNFARSRDIEFTLKGPTEIEERT